MKRAGFILFLFFCVWGGCSGPQATMTIHGTTSTAYDGYRVYLVPLPNPAQKQVDSVTIHNGRFTFRVAADSARICDIALSRKAGAHTERLLVVIEPGNLDVVIDSVSRGGGTPLNDTLQGWKERMADNRRLASRTADSQERNSLLNAFKEETVRLIANNPNVLGGFLYWLHRNNLTEEQHARLKTDGLDKWLDYVR